MGACSMREARRRAPKAGKLVRTQWVAGGARRDHDGSRAARGGREARAAGTRSDGEAREVCTWREQGARRVRQRRHAESATRSKEHGDDCKHMVSEAALQVEAATAEAR